MKIVASIGIFDGVHRGHQKILARLVKEAAKHKSKSLVVTFEPHPREVLNPGSRVALLTSLQHRLDLIKGLGIDFLLVVKFTKSFSRIKAEDFINAFLVSGINIKTIVVGANFLFGARRKGDFRLLKKASKKFGFRLIGVKPLKIGSIYVSSTNIRKKIQKGDLKDASKMLGRPVTVFGTVIKGRSIGRKIGFPTANIDPHHEAIPPSGVYAVNVRLDKRIFAGILNIGTRPTFGRKSPPVIELHIFNYNKNLYGKDIKVIFKVKIRNERKFPSIESLRRQIEKDIQFAKRQ